MKTKHMFGIALALILGGAALLDCGLKVSGSVWLTAGIVIAMLAPLIVSEIHNNDGKGF